MQYYNEEKMHNLRLLIEEEHLNCANVTTKKMYGCPCYKNKENYRIFGYGRRGSHKNERTRQNSIVKRIYD